MRQLVVGTAGHIDHGKSALVRALTGKDPDRLAEERRRGITIDLGFADLPLDDARTVSFVDVPGHERFVRHMIAGAGGVDAVLLVVAADEGVQPQTLEHLAICRLLRIGAGIVALSKCDRADADVREVVRLELAERLAGTFLERAPAIETSARTGTGLDALRAALGGLFDRVEPRAERGVPRLPIDRSFSLKGFGSVVTGTLAAGALAVGDEIAVLPGDRRGRIRGLQVHGRPVERAGPGTRVAVNVGNLDTAELPRGATLTRPDGLATARRALVQVELLPGAPEALARTGGPVRFHQGTFECAARLRPLGDPPAEGVALPAELRLAAEAVLAPGDRFVLRRPAPVDTVGGGTVVDPGPGRLRRAEAAARASETPADPEGALAARVERAGLPGVEAAALRRWSGLGDAFAAALDALERAGRVRAAAGQVVSAASWREAGERLDAALAAHHRRRPLEPGLDREGARAAVDARIGRDVWRALLEERAAAGAIRLEGERVARADHRVRLDPAAARLAERLAARYRDAGLDPPDRDGVLAAESDAASARAVLDWLRGTGVLVPVAEGRWFHADSLDDLRGRLARRAAADPDLDVAAFKELAGVTRKNAIPLLEFLDAERSTRRVGDRREILLRPREDAPTASGT